jgi:hypothetical protein
MTDPDIETNTQGTAGGDNVNINGYLDYPRDFFNIINGKGPVNAEEAALLWSYRKNRPKFGSKETQSPDGLAMMEEINTLRNDLRDYVKLMFIEGARVAAKKHNLLMPDTNTYPVTLSDIKVALCALERIVGKTDAEQKAYHVCHEFHHYRDWLSNTVDKWLIKKKIKLVSSAQVEKQKRGNTRDRGGFGAAARGMKNQVTQLMVKKMFKSLGWCVAVSDKGSQSTNTTYQAIKLKSNSGDDVSAYVVTRNNVDANEVRSLC